MVKHVCNRCQKQFNRKEHYSNHVKRKYPCKVYMLGEHVLPKKEKKTTVFCTKKKFECMYCKKAYTRNSSLNRHIDNVCKIKKQYDVRMETIMNDVVILNEFVKDIKKDLKNLKTVLNENIKIAKETRKLLEDNLDT